VRPRRELSRASRRKPRRIERKDAHLGQRPRMTPEQADASRPLSPVPLRRGSRRMNQVRRSQRRLPREASTQQHGGGKRDVKSGRTPHLAGLFRQDGIATKAPGAGKHSVAPDRMECPASSEIAWQTLRKLTTCCRVVTRVDTPTVVTEDRADGGVLRHRSAVPVQPRSVELPVRRECRRIRREARRTAGLVDR